MTQVDDARSDHPAGNAAPRATTRRRMLGAAVFLALLVAALTAWQVDRTRRLAAIVRADPDLILADPRLRATALALGGDVFAEHCAACHGATGRGNPATGTPDLTDSDHLYGTGQVSEVEAIVRHGIRAGDRRGWNLAAMPAFANPRPYPRYKINPLSPAQIKDLTQFVLGMSSRATDAAAASRGAVLFAGKGGCYDCHLRDAAGDPAIGAPNLTDSVWLYGGSASRIHHVIAQGAAGYSPAFASTLTAAQQRAVAAYTASLAPAMKAQP